MRDRNVQDMETPRIILAEPVSLSPVKGGTEGHLLHHVRELLPGSKKHDALGAILTKKPVSFFVGLHGILLNHLGDKDPLVIVTDWSDPREVVGLRLETENGVADYPALCFLAFETNWDDLAASDIAHIFAHELSHLWLSRLGFDFGLSPSNRFHTSTAITDRYMAFSEGFAEHFELVTTEIMHAATADLYDRGYDIDAWLCARDKALRCFAVKSNRFLYHTATPCEEAFDTYQHLHMAHITSSAFLPERLKNGLQAVSSEGLIASFFYRMYKSELAKSAQAPQMACECPREHEEAALTGFYAKVLHALSEVDLKKPSLFTDFVLQYAHLFPKERDEVLEIFAEVTNYVTCEPGAASVFEALYRVGRRGVIDDVQTAYYKVAAFKKRTMERLKSGELPLDAAIYPSLWTQGDKWICPTPWEPESEERLKFDVNAATAVDFYAMEGLSFSQCIQLEKLREHMGGFPTMEAFEHAVAELKPDR